MSKIITTIIVAFLVVLLIGGGIWAFIAFGKKGTVDDTESTSDDGFASMSARFYTDTGEGVGDGLAQALIGGTSMRTHVIFDLAATNTGNVALTDVEPSAPNVNMDGAFGYSCAFLDEAFGGLIRTEGKTFDKIEAHLEMASEEEPYLIEEIFNYMKKASNV